MRRHMHHNGSTRAGRLLRRALARTPFVVEQSGWDKDAGFGLVEVIVALLVLAIAITFLSGGLTSSLLSTAQSQYRTTAAEVASQTIQEAQNLGYATVSEGIACPIPSGSQYCSKLAEADPNNMVQYSSTDHCFYYGSPANKLLVPTTNESSSPSSATTPIIPYATGPGTSYPTSAVNGMKFTVATYPVFNLNQYTNDSCSQTLSGTDPSVPVTVVVEVSWGAGTTQRLSMQTVLYAPPDPIVQAAAPAECPSQTFQQAGAHYESLLASPGPSATIAPGSTAWIFFLDEAPTPYNPTFCVTDSEGITEQLSITPTYYFYGTGSSNPYLKASCIVAVNPGFGASGPNADDPNNGTGACYTGGTPANAITTVPTSGDLEELISFQVPSVAPSGLTFSSLTITGWDHEGDMDMYTWNVS